MNNLDLTVVIVSWNVRDRLKENLLALRATDHSVSFEVFVVDNNSADDTVAMVRSEFPEVKLIANSENLGFAKANNQATMQAKGRHILLLNPDMKVFPDTLSKMVTWFDAHPQAGVASCKLIDEKGEVIRHVRRFPQLIDQVAIVLKLPHLVSGILDKYLVKNFNYDLPAKVDSVRGAFFMMRRISGKLPLLDERYFLWFEEVDYCRQIRNQGLEVWYTPVASCIDFVGGSFSQVKRGKTQDYFRDSMLKYFLRWHPGWQYNLLQFAWPIGRGLAVVAEKLKVNSRVKT